MNDYGCSVLVNDNEGNQVFCTLEDIVCSLSERNEVICTIDINRKIPDKFEELSEYERSTCRSSVSVFGA